MLNASAPVISAGLPMFSVPGSSMCVAPPEWQLTQATTGPERLDSELSRWTDIRRVASTPSWQVRQVSSSGSPSCAAAGEANPTIHVKSATRKTDTIAGRRFCGFILYLKSLVSIVIAVSYCYTYVGSASKITSASYCHWENYGNKCICDSICSLSLGLRADTELI